MSSVSGKLWNFIAKRLVLLGDGSAARGSAG
jgi:hypothetical protein